VGGGNAANVVPTSTPHGMEIAARTANTPNVPNVVQPPIDASPRCLLRVQLSSVLGRTGGAGVRLGRWVL